MRKRSGPVRLLSWLLGPLWRFRRLALASEAVYWDLLLRSRVANGTAPELERADRPVKASLRPLIEQVPTEPVRILEVGSGPIASVGFSLPGRRLQITATDVLAKQYDWILRRHNIKPAVRTIYADAERLTAQFGADAFDLVYASNCIDHMQDPLAAIREMVNVVRPGRNVVMEHLLDEGAHQDYAGLHQWNLHAEDGRAILWNRSQRHDLNDLLAQSCDVRASLQDENLYVEIRKR